MRTALVALSLMSLVATTGVVGCSSNDSSDASSAPAPIDVNDAAALKSATDIEGTLNVGSAVTIGYERKPEYTRVPYLAVELVYPKAEGTSKEDTQAITVTGTFPGTPVVLVVDASYAVIPTTATTAVDAAGTSVTTVLAPRARKGSFVIVHDSLWSLPMTFEIAIAP